jgi:hypothetical protein
MPAGLLISIDLIQICGIILPPKFKLIVIGLTIRGQGKQSLA